MKKLTNIEINVLAVALDHMEEHLTNLREEGWRTFYKEKMAALETLKTKLL